MLQLSTALKLLVIFGGDVGVVADRASYPWNDLNPYEAAR